jgi:hypothetical protein
MEPGEGRDESVLWRETVDHSAITRLLAAYADTVSRRQWADLSALFRADAVIRVDTVTRPPVDLAGAAALGEFIAGAIERFSFFELVTLNARVNVDAAAGTARGRVFISEIRLDRVTAEWSRTYGVYHDDYRRGDGRWQFAGRAYQSLARTGSDVAFPHPIGFELS